VTRGAALWTTCPGADPLRRTAAAAAGAASLHRNGCTAPPRTGEDHKHYLGAPGPDRIGLRGGARAWSPLAAIAIYVTIVSDTDIHTATAWAAAEEGADHSGRALCTSRPRIRNRTKGRTTFRGHVD